MRLTELGKGAVAFTDGERVKETPGCKSNVINCLKTKANDFSKKSFIITIEAIINHLFRNRQVCDGVEFHEWRIYQ